MWFKEYVFNVLIQPFHLVIYTIIVGSAIELATKSLIYAVVAIYFLIPAEKLLRKFFGFDNAGTLSAAGSFAGGALFSAMIQRINRPKPPEPKDEKKEKEKVRKPSRNGSVNADQVIGTYSDGAAYTGGRRRWSEALEVLADGTGIGGGRPTLVAPDGTPISSGGSALDPFMPKDDFTKSAIEGRFGIPRLAMDNIGGRLSGAARAGLYSAGYRMKKGLVNKAKSLPKSVGRMTRRGVLGGLGAGTMAMLAAGVAATTGDPAKAAAMMTAAGAAGANFTNFYGDKAVKAFGGTIGGAYASAKTGFWGSDSKAIEQYKFDKEFLNSPETLDALTKSLGSRNAAKEAISNGSVQALLNNNITDASKIGKALKLSKKYAGANPTEAQSKQALAKAVAMAKWNRDLNPAVLVSMSEQQNEFRESMRKRGFSNSKIDEILADLDEFNT